MWINLGKSNGICNLCIEHRISVEKLCDFIQNNVHILEYLENDKIKFYKYKKHLELLRTIYLHIKNWKKNVEQRMLYFVICDTKPKKLKGVLHPFYYSF